MKRNLQVVCVLSSLSLKENCHSLEYSAELLLFDGTCLWPILARLMLFYTVFRMSGMQKFLYRKCGSMMRNQMN